MAKAIYAFSGDPITFGHIDIVARAARVFPEVVVGIGTNPDKKDKYTFTLDERKEMAQRSLAHLRNVSVVTFPGMLVDYAYEQGIGVIIKGVRNSADNNYEQMLDLIGKSQKVGIDTHVLYCNPDLAHVSSGAVKAIQREQGLLEGYVTQYVKQCLEARISGQYIVGVTGDIGVGKSYVGKQLAAYGTKLGYQTHHIELDEIGHDILNRLTEPAYQEVRGTIAQEFGKDVLMSNGFIDRKALGKIVFEDQSKLELLNKIMYLPLTVRLRRELYGKRGLILFNAALIAEADLSFVSNNNALLVHANKATQQERLHARSLTDEQIQRRLESQYDYHHKLKSIEATIARGGHGTLWTIDNSEAPANQQERQRQLIFDEIVRTLNVPSSGSP